MRKLIVTLLFVTFLPGLVPSQLTTDVTQNRTQSTETEGERAALLEPPADFVGDGCTMFPDGKYGDCCRAHDRDYYRGGTKAERKASDKRLEQCVRDKGHKFLSKIMYFGVRIGGIPWLSTSFRWGYGQDLKTKRDKEEKDKDKDKDKDKK